MSKTKSLIQEKTISLEESKALYQRKVDFWTRVSLDNPQMIREINDKVSALQQRKTVLEEEMKRQPEELSKWTGLLRKADGKIRAGVELNQTEKISQAVLKLNNTLKGISNKDLLSMKRSGVIDESTYRSIMNVRNMDTSSISFQEGIE